MEDKLLDKHEVAKFLSVKPVTVQRMAKRAELPAHKVGNAWRFRMEDIELYLEERRNVGY